MSEWGWRWRPHCYPITTSRAIIRCEFKLGTGRAVADPADQSLDRARTRIDTSSCTRESSRQDSGRHSFPTLGLWQLKFLRFYSTSLWTRVILPILDTRSVYLFFLFPACTCIWCFVTFSYYTRFRSIISYLLTCNKKCEDCKPGHYVTLICLKSKGMTSPSPCLVSEYRLDILEKWLQNNTNLHSFTYLYKHKKQTFSLMIKIL